MATFKRWLTVTRVLGLIAVALGLVGFGVTYLWVPTFNPDYRSGLLLCGLLTMAGIALISSSRAARRESPASLISVAASSAMVVALFAAVIPELALRLWFETVTHVF